ncbi:MAG TPA: GlsB/YeaQ/YmgE family stress response membrane protein [Planctomycetota bacterium]
MNFVYFGLLGLVAGWLAGKITKGSGFGLIGNLVVGVLGAMLGGLVSGLVGISANGLLGSLAIALGGAILLLFLLGRIDRK